MQSELEKAVDEAMVAEREFKLCWTQLICWLRLMLIIKEVSK